MKLIGVVILILNLLLVNNCKKPLTSCYDNTKDMGCLKLKPSAEKYRQMADSLNLVTHRTLKCIY